MSGVAEIIAELRQAHQRLDEAIGVANRARHQVETATTSAKHTLAGTSNRDAMATTVRWDQAQERLDRLIGRMLTASRDIDRYIAAIAPGAGMSGVAGVGQSRDDPGVNPFERDERAAALGGLIRRAVRNAGDVQDAATEFGTLAGRGFNALYRSPPAGTSSAGPPHTTPTTTSPSPPAAKVDPGDLVGHLVVVATGAAAMSYRFGQWIRRTFRRPNSGN